MTGHQLIIGIDPGPTPGVVGVLCRSGQVDKVATFTTPEEALSFAEGLGVRPWVAVERFIVGRGTARKTRAGSMETITQAETVREAVTARGWPLQFLPAGSVKPIVTDARLRRFGVWDTLSTRHQRDAARHAIYMGLKHGALDPVLACNI